MFTVEKLSQKLHSIFILSKLANPIAIPKINPMKNPCDLYKSQHKRAKEVLDILEKQRDEINLKLKSNACCPHLNKDLRTINLDIRITLNEIEHAEYNILECESQTNSSLN